MLERIEAPRPDDSAGGPSSLTSSSGVPQALAHPRRKVAILGFAETVKDAPFNDPSWELWAMNGFHRHMPEISEERYSLWFDMHSLEYITSYGHAAKVPGQQEAWLAQPHPFPILMLEEHPEFPSVNRYPIEKIVESLGRDYFTSSVAYALAIALTMADVAEIGLWGIDLVHGTEWGDQRPCAEYWIGRAEAAGVRVTIHERSALLRQRARYGYETTNPVVRELRTMLLEQAEGLTKSIRQAQADIDARKCQAHTDDGALQAVRGLIDRLDIWERGGRI